MGLVSFTPFGRGSTASPDDLDVPYQTLRTLAAAGISTLNFSPTAGLNEKSVRWWKLPGEDYPQHQHQKSGIAKSSISDYQMEEGYTSQSSGYARCFSPKTLCLFGHSLNEYAVSSSAPREGHIDFAETSRAQVAFQAGTQPILFVNPYVSTGDNDPPDTLVKCMATNVDSTGFDFIMSVPNLTWEGNSSINAYVMYIAFGIAPGFLSHPTELLD